MKANDSRPVQALQHIKVLDLSRVLAGPWAAQTLGDLGAEVIKVERPGTGDDTRAWGPPYVADAEGQPTGESAYYMCTNRNKQSISVDFTRGEGQEIVRQLAARCDVLIENFKTGGLAQYGLDYASLSALNPRLVYCSVTGFGQDGPYAHRAGYDFLIQGMGGLMSISGHADGQPGGGPMKVGVALTDILTGLYASTAILAALQAREHTGRGQYIDLALLDVGVACLANQSMNYLYGDQVPQRMGNAHPNTVPYQEFPTEDGHMILAVGNDGQFARFCQAAGRSEWAEDERFRSNAARLAHRAELVAMIRRVTLTRSTRAWVQLLEQHAVPCGPINTVREVFEDPQVRARGMQIAMTHPKAGQVPLVASPIRLSDTPVMYRHAPPQLGQHTQELLERHLGLSVQQMQAYRDRGVLG
ncbi:CaiB/BaiF CoA transferase family protein [Comamonas thiooxydans]|uniref:CoA transferase n=1 Tax=Comamonas thiooxydans TaxID=363952 RepID=A0A0E3BUK0_9BURK|nr:CaiB/BaiF CoA-transferase family protein [Comamonas thiooxydans]KGH08670.1 CoA transferase [Comamonas thiooxydans]KGH15301.1 CoA transferase [Comamonas thiooxydans]KGH20426.1 CoA transferase [Comamonas thiooxydans]